MVAETVHIDAVEAGKVAGIFEPDADLGDIGQGAVGEGERRFEPFEDLPGLSLDAACDHHAGLVGWNLAGDKNKIAAARRRG